MSDKKHKFHEFALKSSLFKGQSDWYFCFLKSERIAHVLTILAQGAPEESADDLYLLRDKAATVPHAVAQMAAGEIAAKNILADVFSLISTIRLLGTRSVLTKDTARIILEEYEALAEKLDAGERVSPFVTAQDFAVPLLPSIQSQVSLSAELSETGLLEATPIKDISKGHSIISQQQKKRLDEILALVRERKSVSIKDISAIIRGCSEKTIQRELGELIRQGHIKKIGERRWSQYIPI